MSGTSAPLSVLGVGAFSDDLDALKRFFTIVAEDSSIAFIVVQHLDA